MPAASVYNVSIGSARIQKLASEKKPLHDIYALNSADQEKAENPRNFIGKQNLSRKDIDVIRALIKESGALDASKKISTQHEKAKLKAKKAKD